jgi:hypothetical protein
MGEDLIFRYRLSRNYNFNKKIKDQLREDISHPPDGEPCAFAMIRYFGPRSFRSFMDNPRDGGVKETYKKNQTGE